LAAYLLAGGFLDYAIRKTGSKRWTQRFHRGLTAAGLCAFAVSRTHSAVAVMSLSSLLRASGFGVPSMWSLPTDIEARRNCRRLDNSAALSAECSVRLWRQGFDRARWNATFVVFGAIYLLGALPAICTRCLNRTVAALGICHGLAIEFQAEAGRVRD
jgi:hypothetical protein